MNTNKRRVKTSRTSLLRGNRIASLGKNGDIYLVLMRIEMGGTCKTMNGNKNNYFTPSII